MTNEKKKKTNPQNFWQWDKKKHFKKSTKKKKKNDRKSWQLISILWIKKKKQLSKEWQAIKCPMASTTSTKPSARCWIEKIMRCEFKNNSVVCSLSRFIFGFIECEFMRWRDNWRALKLRKQKRTTKLCRSLYLALFLPLSLVRLYFFIRSFYQLNRKKNNEI